MAIVEFDWLHCIALCIGVDIATESPIVMLPLLLMKLSKSLRRASGRIEKPHTQT